MGSNYSSSDTSDDDINDDENTSDVEGDHDKDVPASIDLTSLFDNVSLRILASKVREDIPENVVQQHSSTLTRWLEERQQQNEETVTQSQFYDVLVNRSVGRDECIEAFQQFDSEGDGTADVATMLEALKASAGTKVQEEMAHVVRTLQACSLTPGFIDVYNEDKESIGQHGTRLLNFLLRNRAPSSAVPFPILNGFHNTTHMRLSALENAFSKIKESVSRQHEESILHDGEELRPIDKCFSSVDVSTNKADVMRLFNRDHSSYWQSDGSARSHWIRFRMKSNVVVKQLSVGISVSDQSYMPNLVAVSVGKSTFNLREIKEVRIPSHVNGDVMLVEDLKTYYPIIQINIKRCQSDGCDTRIHSVKIVGYRVVRDSGISVADASAAWYLQIMASTTIASISLAPQLRQVILNHSKQALQNMPPLSISPTSGDRPGFMSPYVLKELSSFLTTIAQEPDEKLSVEGLQVLLAFNLARGYIAGILRTLIRLKAHRDRTLELRPLLNSLDKVRDTFWSKTGSLLTLTLAGCDGGQKEETSGPSNLLAGNWTTSQNYLSGDSKTKVNIFLTGPDHVQITKIRLKVDKGARGPRCGLVFVYKDAEKFDLDKHVARFSDYDSWRSTQYNFCNSARSAGITKKEDIPVAFFTMDDDWDEVEISLDTYPVGKYVLIKFLEARQESAERLGVAGLKFYGFNRKSTFLSSYDVCKLDPVDKNTEITGSIVLSRVMVFLTSLTKDQDAEKKSSSSRPHNIDISDISIELVWQLYNTFSNKLCQVLTLQLLHALFPYLASPKNQNQEISEKFFQYLCSLVDDAGNATDMDTRLHLVAKQVIVDGAAVFFPDKEARRKQLFSMMSNGSNDVTSVTLTFQSLCQFFSSIDPSGLLDLPQTITEDFDPDPVLQVLDTLISVAYREFCVVIATVEVSDHASHLVQLLCSLQTSLLAWAQRQIQGANKEHGAIAQGVIVRYVSLLRTKTTQALVEFGELEQETMMNVVSKLESSFLSTVLRQLTLILTLLADHLSSLVRTQLVHELQVVCKELRKLSSQLPQVFYKIASEAWQTMEKGEVILRTWEVESTHNYENNLHTKQVFTCPGASTFIIEFDPRCETEKRYDYLEFTDSRGIKMRFDQKVGSDKWQTKVTFHGGHRLQFLFHSDGSNSEWGYKFKIAAKGSPDVPLCWMFDLQLSLCKLVGRLCGSTLDVNQVLPKSASADAKDEAELDLLKSELWTTLFRGGYMVGKLQRSFSGSHMTEESADLIGFVVSLSEEPEDNEESPSEKFYNRCAEDARLSTPHIGGADVGGAVRAAFSALIWHTQQLREDLEKYIKNNGECRISDGILQAYKTADSLRKYLVDQRQKQTVAAEKSGEKDLYDYVEACKEKSLFLLKFAGLSKVHLKSEMKGKNERRMSKFQHRHHLQHFKLDLDRHPSFRLVLDFVRDPAWSKERVEQLLKQRAQQAQAVSEVYMATAEFIRIMGEDDKSIFQIPNVVFLQELFAYQDKFAKHYGDGLDGCGLDLESRVRRSYYTLVRRMVDSLRGVNRLELPRSLLPCYDFMQACTLHLLDVNWQLYDLFLLVDLKLPELYLKLAKGTVSMREKVCGSVDKARELQDYTRNMKWLKECTNSSFMQWYNKYKKKEGKDKDEQKAEQMFVARFCDLLDVEISCDGCNDTLPGRRYRCLQCQDMDLCSTCYAGGVKPDGEHAEDHEIVHLQYKCDECYAFIVGTRIHCNQCENFDLCLGCNEQGNFPAGHTGDHDMTTYPMVKWKTNLEADSSVLSYIHQHVWLLYSSLALSMANLLYTCTPSNHGNTPGARPAPLVPGSLDPDYIKAATSLYNMSIDLAVKCLLLVSSEADTDTEDDDDTPAAIQARQEEAFALHSQERIMGLLGAMLPSENVKSPLVDDVSMVFSTEEFLSLLFHIATGDSGHDSNTQHFAMGLIGQILQRTSTQCKVVDSAVVLAKAKQKIEKSSTCDSVTIQTDSATDTKSDSESSALPKPVVPKSPDPNHEKILSSILNKAGINLPSAMVPAELPAVEVSPPSDSAVSSLAVTPLSPPVDSEGDVVFASDLVLRDEGSTTAEFLFSFGATCLERSGLEWANAMAGILQKLFNTVMWRDVLQDHLSLLVDNLKLKPELSSIFALFVVAGFPEVLSVGSPVRYVDVGTETKEGVVLKYFPDKNQILLVDRKNRKRRTLKDEYVECLPQNVHIVAQQRITAFISIITTITTRIRNGEQVGVSNMWVLSLTLKALLMTLTGSQGEKHADLFSPDFVRCVVYLASQGTGYSKQWLLKDLEILSLMLFTREHEESEAENGQKVSTSSYKDSLSPGGAASSPGGATSDDQTGSPGGSTEKGAQEEEEKGENPWDGLDDTTRLCFQTLHEHLSVPVSVLRAIYDLHGKNTDSLLMEVHDNFEGISFTPSDQIKQLAKKWEKPQPEVPDLAVDKAVDVGVQLGSLPDDKPSPPRIRTIDHAEDEPSEISTCPIQMADNDLESSTQKQRRTKSASLLKKELESKGRSNSKDTLLKVNMAMTVLYSRQVLTMLLGDWPRDGRTITAALIGCKAATQIPFVLDLLHRPESREMFQKVVHNVIKHCELDDLVTVAMTSCQFMEEVNVTTVIKESDHNYKNNAHIEDKVHIPGAPYLSIKFDTRCCTEEACDDLTLSSSSDYKQDRRVFCGPRNKWTDFDMPGDTLFFRFTSDSSNNEWGYRFTITGGRMGRFDTGYMILSGVLSVASVTRSLPLGRLWSSLVYVACKQTGLQRLKATQLMLKLLQSQRADVSPTPDLCLDLSLLRPLWRLYSTLTDTDAGPGALDNTVVLPSVVRALTELFLRAEDLAKDWGVGAEYAASLQDKKDVEQVVYQGLLNVAAVSKILQTKNKATEGFQALLDQLAADKAAKKT